MTTPIRMLAFAPMLALAACSSEPAGSSPAVASPEGVEPGQTLGTPDGITPDASPISDDAALENTPLNPGVTEPRSQTPSDAEISSPGS